MFPSLGGAPLSSSPTARRLNTLTLAPDEEQRGHDRRTDEQPDQPEAVHAAEYPDEGPQEGEADRIADQRRLHEIVAGQHDRAAVAEQQRAGDRLPLEHENDRR